MAKHGYVVTLSDGSQFIYVSDECVNRRTALNAIERIRERDYPDLSVMSIRLTDVVQA